MKTENFGEWAYLASVAIAILAGIGTATGMFQSEWTAVLLVLLGLVVGFLNVTEKETTSFLVATVALVVASTAVNFTSALPVVGGFVAAVLTNIAIFAAPAAVIVAVKAILNLASK